MQMATARTGSGQREVEPFAIQAPGERSFVQAPLAGFVGLFERLLGAVEQLAEGGARIGRQLAHSLPAMRARLAAQHLDARRFQFLEGARGANPLERTGDQFRMESSDMRVELSIVASARGAGRRARLLRRKAEMTLGSAD